jgi:uncharacterized RmlC-like cupin family protein
MSDAEKPKECRVVRAAATYAGKQGLDYAAGVSAESVGSAALCLHLLTIPPGARARAHLHENHESAVYVLSGEAVMWHGPALERRTVVRAGDMVYIPAGVPHLPANLSGAPVTAVVARTDPNEQESVLLRPDLDALARD